MNDHDKEEQDTTAARPAHPALRTPVPGMRNAAVPPEVFQEAPQEPQEPQEPPQDGAVDHDAPEPAEAPSEAPSEAPAALTVGFYANRNVRILGKAYGAGDPITDPNIPGRVLQTLMRTGRVVQRAAGETTAREVAGRAPLAPEAEARGRAAGGRAGPPAATRRNDDASPWRRAWDRAKTKREIPEDTSFRQYLQATAEVLGLSANGSVTQLVDRLNKSGKLAPGQ
jgi:hypothetical protein